MRRDSQGEHTQCCSRTYRPYGVRALAAGGFACGSLSGLPEAFVSVLLLSGHAQSMYLTDPKRSVRDIRRGPSPCGANACTRLLSVNKRWSDMVRGRVARRRVLLAMSSSGSRNLDFLTRRPWASACVLAHTTLVGMPAFLLAPTVVLLPWHSG